MLLADPPAGTSADQATAVPSAQGPEQSSVPARACASCGAELPVAQEWCLRCGAGAPGSLGSSRWRGSTIVILGLLALVGSAAIAGVAALTRHNAAAPVVVKTIAQNAPALTAPSTTPGTTPTNPTTPGFTNPGLTSPRLPRTSVPKIPTTGGATLPRPSTTVPKLPFFNSTPKPSGTTTQPLSTTPKETRPTPSGSSGNGTESTGTTSQPSAILLDTDAASTYNPYGYAEANFGEPGLAIDGDTSTAWSAQVNPAVAPRMADGLVLDLKTAHHLGLLELHTSTPGATVEIYGSNGHTLPASITDPAWSQLSGPHALKRVTKLKLHKTQKAYRFLVVWFTKAPPTSTAQAPGHVAINELSLFPPASS